MILSGEKKEGVLPEEKPQMGSEGFQPEEKSQKKKKSVMKRVLGLLLLLLCLAAVLAGAVFLYWGYTKTHYEISFYQETSKKVSRNIRLAVISDIHNREYGEGNETLISDTRALKPDLILFAGDMVIKSEDNYEPMLKLVSAMADIAPCYGIMGNHEDERIYLKSDKKLPEKFEKAGMKVLRNRMETVQIGADKIQLLGISSTTAYGFEEYGARKFMDGADIDPNAYSIVMAHVPMLFDSQISAYRFDLGIAGHTHGGLVDIPGLGGLYSDEEGFFPKYYKGKQLLSNGASLIISRGLGDSRQIPRINNMPELLIIDINWY